MVNVLTVDALPKIVKTVIPLMHVQVAQGRNVVVGLIYMNHSNVNSVEINKQELSLSNYKYHD